LSTSTTEPPKLDKSEARVRQMFGEIAPRYDLLNHLLSAGIDRRWRTKTVRRVPAEGTAPVLDLCTGTGDLALAYAQATGGRVPIFGADFCHEMLTRADDKARRDAPSAPPSFVEADAQRLPFADDMFQLVTVAFGLRNVTDTDRGLREMARVCRPGGRLAVLEFSLPEQPILRSVYGWYFRRVLPRIGQLLARNRQSAYNYLPESVQEFPSGEALAVRMRAAGLGHVEYERLTFGVATLYVGTK